MSLGLKLEALLVTETGAKRKINMEMSSENYAKQLMISVSILSCSSVDFEESQSFKILRCNSDYMINL